MKEIPNEERQRLGALLDHERQETVMAMIPQFGETEVENLAPPPAEVPAELGALVFNMERGVHLEELGDFLRDCPDIRPLDVVLANELDDGCVRSGGRNTARELAERFGWNYNTRSSVIELVNGEDPKGFHGNAVFSRWPIRKAWTIRLPEQYNWYFDRQRRIGGRCAVLAELDIGAGPWEWPPSIWRTGPTAPGAAPSWRRCSPRRRSCCPASRWCWAEISTPTPLTAGTRTPSARSLGARSSSAAAWRRWLSTRPHYRRRRPGATGRCRRSPSSPGASPCRRAVSWACGWTGCCCGT